VLTGVGRRFFVSTFAVRKTFADPSAPIAKKKLAHLEHIANSPGRVASKNFLSSSSGLRSLNSFLMCLHMQDAPFKAAFCPRLVL
jgi:hypothetical protein